MTECSHRERLGMILAGQKPDRFAASFWRHFFHKEHYAEGTAEAMLDFQEQFDWDFMKVNPRADYHAEGWGLKLEWSHHEFKKHIKSDFPIVSPGDWRKIEPLKLSTPALDEHLRVVSIVRKKSGRDLPILMTVFTPLAVAGRLVEDDRTLVDHIRSYPDKVLPALEAITLTFEAFVSEVRNAGADGLFFATTQWASSDLVSWEEYQQFGVPFDLRVIRAAGEDAINLLHVCSSNNFLKELSEIDYHCRMYNWDSEDATNLPIDRGCDVLSGKTVVGGVDQHGWLRDSAAEEVRYRMDRIKSQLDPARVIFGPGCSIPPETPAENLKAVRERL